MASIRNLTNFNDSNKRRLIAFNKEKEESFLLTTEEVRTIVRNFLEEELNHFAFEIAKERRQELETLVIAKLADIEGVLMASINNKVAKIAEKIYHNILTSEFESLVNKAVDEKIEKIRKELLKKI